jgi:hypothetical protein
VIKTQYNKSERSPWSEIAGDNGESKKRILLRAVMPVGYAVIEEPHLLKYTKST